MPWAYLLLLKCSSRCSWILLNISSEYQNITTCFVNCYPYDIYIQGITSLYHGLTTAMCSMWGYNPEGSTGPECSGVSNDGRASVLRKSYIALGLVTWGTIYSTFPAGSISKELASHLCGSTCPLEWGLAQGVDGTHFTVVLHPGLWLCWGKVRTLTSLCLP